VNTGKQPDFVSLAWSYCTTIS